MRLVVCLLLVGLAVSCSAGGGVEDLACGEFHRFAVDATDGVITAFDYRERLEAIESRAAGSEVHAEARAMLAAFVQDGRGSRFNAAIRAMSSACDAYR